MIEDPQVIVSSCWLHERINDPDVRIIDASWYLAAMNRNPIAEYNSQHIPGAWFFDGGDRWYLRKADLLVDIGNHHFFFHFLHSGSVSRCREHF